MNLLKDKVAVITGASMGIGLGIAEVFAAEGAKLVLIARSEKVKQIAEDLCKRGFEAIAMQGDVTGGDDMKRCAEMAAEHFGGINILVNNAGVCKLGAFEQSDISDLEYHLSINVKGAWNATQAVLPYLKLCKGKIVNMSSVTGDMVADPGEVAYATSKSALVGFTKALAVELAQYGINVNAICPGYIRTPMAEGIARQSDDADPQGILQGIADAVPLGRLGLPEEVGHLAAFLASSNADYLTGGQFVIDGGSTLPETISVGA